MDITINKKNKMKNILKLNWQNIIFITILLLMFSRCNVTNKAKSVDKKTVDSVVNKSLDSSKFVKNDSISLNKIIKDDSFFYKRIDNKKIIINFDTSQHPDSVYHYEIDGKKITTPNKVTSAIIDDSSEDDSSFTFKKNSIDSVAVHSLDTEHVHKEINNHLQSKAKVINEAKKAKRPSLWFIFSIVILIICAGYLIGKKIGFFK
jgi:hypothetical protein